MSEENQSNGNTPTVEVVDIKNTKVHEIGDFVYLPVATNGDNKAAVAQAKVTGICYVKDDDGNPKVSGYVTNFHQDGNSLKTERVYATFEEAAQAKQKELELAKGLSELEKYTLDVERDTKVQVAKAWSEGIAKIRLPETFLFDGGGKESASNPLETFINLLTLEKAKAVNKGR